MSQHHDEVVAQLPTCRESRPDQYGTGSLSLEFGQHRERRQPHASETPRGRFERDFAEEHMTYEPALELADEGYFRLGCSAEHIDQPGFVRSTESALVYAAHRVDISRGFCTNDSVHAATVG